MHNDTLREMLEPWPLSAPLGGPYRGLLIRQGFDLEPSLPDPAPAYLDPEGTLHPALVEPLSALPLHRFPTPGSRAALVARILSAPGRPDFENESDPYVAVYRFAARQDMEPEITGCLALVLLRGLITNQRKGHRTFRPDPLSTEYDPHHDPFLRQRARLRDVDWDGLWNEVSSAASFVGSEPALAFERCILRASSSWLGDYRSWWEVAQQLGDSETMPDELGPLREALARFPIDLEDAMAGGIAAEQQFMEICLAGADRAVDANWLLSQQLRALRNLDLATAEFSLELHELVRRCDVARVRTQLAYRVDLLRLWSAENPREIEARILAIPDPPHATTLGAGLGRLLGVILLSRLRRGETEGASELAQRALQLAPEELSVRVTANDLQYHFGDQDADLLRSLREERARWDSVSVCLMGRRVAERIGDHSTARHFGAHLAQNALELGTLGGWAVCATEVLSSPPGRERRTLATQLSEVDINSAVDDPLVHILFGEGDHLSALEDLKFALLDACLCDDALEDLEVQSVGSTSKRRKSPAWKQLLTKSLVGTDHPTFCARLFSRLQSLRAASSTLREAPLAAEIRALLTLLSRAAELEMIAPVALGELMQRLDVHLTAPSVASGKSLAAWISISRDPLRVDLRKPRKEALSQELKVLAARARMEGRIHALATISQLRADLADPNTDLDKLDLAIGSLGRSLEYGPAESKVKGTPDNTLMSFHSDFDSFSVDELGMRPDALRRARGMVRLFNLSGGQRDRKRLKGSTAEGLFELRQRTSTVGGLRVFYRREGAGWLALAAMSKYDDRQQQEAIDRVARVFSKHHDP